VTAPIQASTIKGKRWGAAFETDGKDGRRIRFEIQYWPLDGRDGYRIRFRAAARNPWAVRWEFKPPREQLPGLIRDLKAAGASKEALASLDDVLHRTMYRAMYAAQRAAAREAKSKKKAAPGAPERDVHGRFVGQSGRKKP
jgi:hypothetical protein